MSTPSGDERRGTPCAPIFAPCPLCDGSGEECVGTDYGNRWDNPPEAIFERCHLCEGTGQAETECEAITIEDLETIPRSP